MKKQTNKQTNKQKTMPLANFMIVRPFLDRIGKIKTFLCALFDNLRYFYGFIFFIFVLRLPTRKYRLAT